ncbi:MAG TPA: hypothetical protein VMV52_09080 [Candidatus Nanopelagicaceae bacterium]|nr:hypothetical protein [Candidatus Nanopelagicaceae bacterium]
MLPVMGTILTEVKANSMGDCMFQNLSRSIAARETLEASRREVVKRVKTAGLPLTISRNQLTVVSNGSSWTYPFERMAVSSLQRLDVQLAAADDSVAGNLMGLRVQLEPLAQLLDQTTDLGKRPFNWFPGMVGIDAILVRYLVPWTDRYLTMLSSLGRPNSSLMESLINDLNDLCDNNRVSRTYQLPIYGVKPIKRHHHKNVSIRPLSPIECGIFYEARQPSSYETHSRTGFAPPRRYEDLMPSSLIEISIERLRNTRIEESTLPVQIALAFFLCGYELSSTGILVSFDNPKWANRELLHSPYPVHEKRIIAEQTINRKQFESVVDLALKIPDFGELESDPKGVALFRLLRACGLSGKESPFLDFVIALEAALLQGADGELAFKFALYGSLFLREERDPQDTFNKLKLIYRVRSKLVHGGKISHSDREIANQNVAELAKAVIRRAVTQGWPNADKLNELAMIRFKNSGS